MSQRMTILVVDDIPLMRTILVKYVKSLGLKILSENLGVDGLEILEASNGKEALECLKSRRAHMIFLDLMMPEMDGLTFLGLKKANPAIAGIPTIVCSALGEKETVDRAKELGARSYIVKPFNMKSVEEKFRDALEACQAQFESTQKETESDPELQA